MLSLLCSGKTVIHSLHRVPDLLPPLLRKFANVEYYKKNLGIWQIASDVKAALRLVLQIDSSLWIVNFAVGIWNSCLTPPSSCFCRSTHWLKITQNVSFQFFNFAKLFAELASLAMLNETFSVIFKQCEVADWFFTSTQRTEAKV